MKFIAFVFCLLIVAAPARAENPAPYDDFGKPFAQIEPKGFQNPVDPGEVLRIEPAAGTETQSNIPDKEETPAPQAVSKPAPEKPAP